jgi:hypothetical protein
VHLPDVLTIPHIVAAQRYKVAAQDPRIPTSGTAEAGVQYLALYEFDTDAPPEFFKTVIEEEGPRLRAAGRGVGIDCMAPLASTLFTAIGVRQEAQPVAAGD